MANETVKCPAIQSRIVAAYNPDSVVGTGNTITIAYDSTNASYAEQSYIRFAYPDEVKYRKVLSMTLFLYVVSVSYSGPPISLAIMKVPEAWDYGTITWNNKPRVSNHFKGSAAFTPIDTLPKGSYFSVRSDFTDVNDFKRIFIDGLHLLYGIDTAGGQRQQTVEFGSHLYIDTPHLNVVTEQVSIYVTGAYPQSGYVDVKKDTTFGWGIGYANPYDIIEKITQKAAKIRWRNAGDVSYTELEVLGESGRCTIPADTFAAQSVEWQVLVQSCDDVWSEPTGWYQLTTQDATPTPVIIAPSDVYITGDVDNLFSWKYIISTGSRQTKAELTYSSDGQSWQPLASSMTSDAFVTIPAATLPTGTLYWRVRTFNADGVASDWSKTAQVVVRGAPMAPSISRVNATARPAIYWQSAEQTAYQVQIYGAGDALLLDTGEVYSADKVLVSADYLDDGGYTTRVRVKSASGIWSQWAQITFTIITEKPPKPIITAMAGDGFIRITAESLVEFRKLYLLRDGEPIAKLQGGFLDYGCIGEHIYTARGIDAADAFADSEPITAVCKIATGAMLAPAGALSAAVPLVLRRGEPAKTAGMVKIGGNARHFAGRRRPVYTFGEYTDESYSVSFSMREQAQFDALRALAERRETVLYRDRNGTCFFGAIQSVSFERDHLSTDFTIELVCVDYTDKIAYDSAEVT